MTASDPAAAKRLLRSRLRRPPHVDPAVIDLKLPPGWPHPGRCVAAYWPTAHEPDLRPGLMALASTGTAVCLPRIHPNVHGLMDFVPWSLSATLRANRYGIAEPLASEVVDANAIGLMLIPGLAFGSDGVRLGSGAGYYDRYASRPGFGALKIGVCFSARVLVDLPCEAHDLRVDYLLTEQGLQQCAVG